MLFSRSVDIYAFAGVQSKGGMVTRSGRLVRAFVIAGAVSVVGVSCAMEPRRPSVEEAEVFVSSAENRLLALWMNAGQAAWVQQNFI